MCSISVAAIKRTVYFVAVIRKADVDNNKDYVSRKTAGKTRMDMIRNEEIRRRVNMQPAEQTANKNNIRWWSHVKRMAPTAPQSKALVIQPEG